MRPEVGNNLEKEPSLLTKTKKLTTDEIAAEYRRHPVTVRMALSSGALHGRQRVPGGRWLIEEPCAEAWSNGDECQHMSNAAEPIELRRMSA